MGAFLGWDDAKVTEYVKALMAQEPIYTKGGTATAAQLAAGQAPIAVGMYSYQIDSLQEKGATVDWVTPDPIGANQTVVMTMRGAKHPAAALLWSMWLASNDGLAVHMTIAGKGSIQGGPDGERIKASGAKVIIEDASNAEEVTRIQDLCAGIIAGK
jgi:ABC-type Fe3+ transport system substrate-binding protein